MAQAMRENDCVIGGEGNGGVINPAVHYVRDSLGAIAFVLSLMAERRAPVSEIVRELPKYHMVKLKVRADREQAEEIIARVEVATESAEINRLDGLRLDWPDRWVHVRPSATEPALRIIGEARRKKDVVAMCQRIEEIARSVVGTSA